MLNFAVTNVANINREIYVWHRSGRELKLFKDSTFFPYFYQPDINGIFKAIDGQKVKKVICSKPYDVAKRRDEDSYEADIIFTKRYVIDKIGQFLPAEIKYSFVDIEVKCPELPSYLNPIYPISCISCSNSYTNEIKTFYLLDYFYAEPEKYTNKDTEILEKQLLDDFVKWVRGQQFDILLGWNVLQFDWRYISARYLKIFEVELADLLSPINTNHKVGKKEENPMLLPTGLGIVDYMDWFKKIYKGRQSYALDNIAQEELKDAANEKVDFNILSDKIKEKNIRDVQRLMQIEKKLKIINYYDELRRMTKSEWSDLNWNSKMLDVMLLTEAKQKGIILPSKKYGLEEVETSFEGAYRRCETGLFKNLWKLDLSSAYPMVIINFCLDIQNIKQNEGININGTKFYQNQTALLPSLARKLINKKDELKKQLKSITPETPEAKDLQTKYDAVKGVVNSLFGVCGLKVFRLFDMRVAGAITFLVRDLLHYVEENLIEQGMRVVYVDTDSCFLEAKDNPKDICNDLVKKWAKEKYNKDEIGIEFDLEGTIKEILIVGMCHYIANVETKKGIKKEIKGVEVKRSDSSKYMKYFQEKLIDKIMNDESKENILKWIEEEKILIKERPLIDIGFPCKLSGKNDYKSPPIFLRGLDYTKEILPSFKKVAGDSFYYISVEPFGKSIRKSSRIKRTEDVSELTFSEKEVNKDVLCFDDYEQSHIKNINWKKVIDKSIDSKVEKIFEAMQWLEPKVRKSRKKKEESINANNSNFSAISDDICGEYENAERHINTE